ncbi:Mu transposase C-terminal domain-containing protein [Streptomyces sp. NPDC059083]|uniref:Mu transposase C-terminal domain-containing protein n=1 Tax=unclassified Streptomyces TaxID=2593676 RepID=UPI00369EEE1E
MLGGCTPLTAWEEDPAPLRRIGADQLRHLMLAGTERIVQKDGINFRSLTYVAPELYGRGEQRVQIRYMPHDDRTVERCINKIKQWRGLATVRQARHHLPRGSPHCGDTTSEDLLHPLH